MDWYPHVPGAALDVTILGPGRHARDGLCEHVSGPSQLVRPGTVTPVP
jgi:hypothetical protein